MKPEKEMSKSGGGMEHPSRQAVLSVRIQTLRCLAVSAPPTCLPSENFPLTNHLPWTQPPPLSLNLLPHGNPQLVEFRGCVAAVGACQ